MKYRGTTKYYEASDFRTKSDVCHFWREHHVNGDIFLHDTVEGEYKETMFTMLKIFDCNINQIEKLIDLGVMGGSCVAQEELKRTFREYLEILEEDTA